jgi:hypothetical protein
MSYHLNHSFFDSTIKQGEARHLKPQERINCVNALAKKLAKDIVSR